MRGHGDGSSVSRSRLALGSTARSHQSLREMSWPWSRSREWSMYAKRDLELEGKEKKALRFTDLPGRSIFTYYLVVKGPGWIAFVGSGNRRPVAMRPGALYRAPITEIGRVFGASLLSL
ncbi:hypothetical protein L249_0223, partial [Ophiocordyceps polyrhachis-furcata BCC 54312]